MLVVSAYVSGVNVHLLCMKIWYSLGCVEVSVPYSRNLRVVLILLFLLFQAVPTLELMHFLRSEICALIEITYLFLHFEILGYYL